MLVVSIVCKDNTRTLPLVLERVRPLADRFVALDSGSTDGTLDLLARFDCRVVREPWRGYVATKQRALEIAAQEGDGWILCLDSDESPEPDAAESLKSLPTPGPSSPAAFEINRKIWYRGRFLRHAWQPEWRTRIVRAADVRAGRAMWTGIDPHDALVADGPVARVNGDFRHEAFTTFDEFLEKQVRHARTSAAALAAQGKMGRVSRVVFSPAAELFKQLVVRGAWRDGPAGWMAAGSSAVASALKHIMLIEKTRQ